MNVWYKFINKFLISSAFWAFIFVFNPNTLSGQQLNCEGNQSAFYQKDVFDTYRLKTVRYSNQKDYKGNEVKLFIDLYLPGSVNNDLGKKRPTIMLIFGGGFRSGSRNSTRIREWAEYYAKKGFVVTVHNYRIGWEGDFDDLCGSGDEEDFKNAMYRAIQDSRTALRFIKSKSNKYGIDTDNIFLKGISAGAMVALSWKFRSPDLESEDRISLLGTLTTEEYKEENNNVQGIISVAGGILSDARLIDGQKNLLLFHGSCDGSVPITAGRLLDCIQFPVFHGSFITREMLKDAGEPTSLHVYCGFGHEFEKSVDGDQNLSKVVNYLLNESSIYIYRNLCDQEQNETISVANDYFEINPLDSCKNFRLDGICNKSSPRQGVVVDVVPSYVKFKNRIFIHLISPEEEAIDVMIYDMQGRKVLGVNLVASEGFNEIVLPYEKLRSGVLIINIRDDSGRRILSKKIVVHQELMSY